jgi:type IV pilus assembly protein PilM
VDIGSRNIKLVHAEPTKQGIRISRVAMCPSPPDCVREGVVINVPEVASAIQFAMRSAGIKASNAVAAVAGQGVVVRHVQLPKMTDQVLRRSIHFEAGKYISTSVEDSTVEFEILGDAEEEGQMNVILVAAPKVMVESRVGTLEQAGLDPVAVDVEAFAMLRALIEYNPDQELSQSTVALLDIGASHTEINLVCKGNLALTRTIPIAGASLTNSIRNAENCTEGDAEQMKHGVDLSQLVEASGTAEQPGLKAIQSLVDELLREIRRSINYYQSQLPDGSLNMNVDRLILTGGTSRLKGLLPYTRSRLNVEVGLGHPVFGKPVSLGSADADSGLTQEDIPLFAVAFGLAMKEMASAAVLPSAA